MLRHLNQIVNIYTTYNQNDYGDVEGVDYTPINARVGLTEITEVDSQGNNVYPGLEMHTETTLELQKGMCVEYNGKTYEIRNLTKTYNRSGNEFFYYIKAIQKNFRVV